MLRRLATVLFAATMLANPAQAARCGGSTEVLAYESYLAIPSVIGLVIRVVFVYRGDRTAEAVGADVVFTDSAGAEFRMPFPNAVHLEPGERADQIFDVPKEGWQIVGDHDADVVICTNTITYADGGGVIIN